MTDESTDRSKVSNTDDSAGEKQQIIIKKRGRRRSARHFKADFNLPGVHKVILNEAAQEAIGCVVGENVTTEKPWTNVRTYLVHDNLETKAADSVFFPFRKQIMEFEADQMLFGYIPDESKDEDEFYICVTQEATDAVALLVEKERRIQEEKLLNAVRKRVKPWKPLGSAEEIEETMIKYNRPFLEVEIESDYPVWPSKVCFRHVKSHDLVGGYMEFRSSEDISLHKKRVDNFVQVTPRMVTNEAQTNYPFPKNTSTQYEYDVPHIDFQENANKIADFCSQNLDTICQILKVNSSINFYTNDYENLICNSKFTLEVATLKSKEYLCFIDMNICKGKMVSNMCWHNMWTGCVVLSYVQTAPQLFLTQQVAEDNKEVHDTNPVLFWSFTDDIKPKLSLETPRPVYALSCCPYDPNLIVGGMLNGQIILWDITNRLNYVEEEEVLTVEQQSYREYMFSLMSWMQNIFDPTKIRPTAISDLKYSHIGCINAITWMSPFHSISKTGKIQELNEDQGRSLQLLTSAEDGTILIWDLLKKPTFTPGGFKSGRKLKRLKKKPSALLVDESPFKKLHLTLKPVYRINVVHVFENHRALSIATFYASFFKAKYRSTARDSKKALRLNERSIYKPVLDFDSHSVKQNFFIGTMEGDFVQAKWEGQEFDPGEIINYEDCQFISYGKYHDGPVVNIDYSPATDTIISVGGKVFAIWRPSFTDCPVLWRKGSSIYSYGNWIASEEASINLIRVDGYLETWTLFLKSKQPVDVVLMSNGAVTQIGTHPRPIKFAVSGLCDYRGSLRLIYRKHPDELLTKETENDMKAFVDKQIQTKKEFLKWQEKWNKYFENLSKEEVVEEKKVIIEDTKEGKEKHEKKKIEKILPGQKYMETIREEHKKAEQARIKCMILERKQLNTKNLLKKREPLRKLEEENECKKYKQKRKLKDSKKIFQDTIAMYFPDVIKEKPPPPPDPYKVSIEESIKQENLKKFQRFSIEALDYIEDNPFSYEFDWKIMLGGRKEKRKVLSRICYIRRNKQSKMEEAKLASEYSLHSLQSQRSRKHYLGENL